MAQESSLVPPDRDGRKPTYPVRMALQYPEVVFEPQKQEDASPKSASKNTARFLDQKPICKARKHEMRPYYMQEILQTKASAERQRWLTRI